jgi:hypothetical protein
VTVASFVRVTADGFAALVAVAQGRAEELEPDVRGQAEAVAGELRAALDAVVAPRTVVDLERRGEYGTCWVGDAVGCLLVPEQPGWFRAFAFDHDELPVALLRAVGAVECARPPGDAVRYDAAELAGVLARGELDGFRAHWRAGDVEVIETAAGSWAVVPDGTAVELRPVDATWVYAAIADLVAGAPAHA